MSIQRATSSRLASAASLLREYQETHGVALGPAETAVVELQIARVSRDTDEPLVDLPSNNAVAQGRHLDELREAARNVRPRFDDNEWVPLQLELGGGIVRCRVNLDDIRTGLGIPAGINFMAAGIVGSTIENRIPQEEHDTPDPDHV